MIFFFFLSGQREVASEGGQIRGRPDQREVRSEEGQVRGRLDQREVRSGRSGYREVSQREVGSEGICRVLGS